MRENSLYTLGVNELLHRYRWWAVGASLLLAAFIGSTSAYYFSKSSSEPQKLYDSDGRDSPYTVDSKHVYFRGNEISNSDPKSFVVLTCGTGAGVGGDGCETYYAKDKNSAYIDGQVWKDVDVATLTYVGGNVMKDANHVYYANFIDDPNCLACKETDASTFVWLGAGRYSGYFKDKQQVYSWRFPVEGADLASFKVVSGQSDYDAEDENHKYLYGRIVSTTTSQTYSSYIEPTQWEWVSQLPSISPDRPDIATDGENLYTAGKKLSGVDIKSFKILNNWYGKDSQHVYTIMGGEEPYVDIVKDADAKTFTAFGTYAYGKDSSRVYWAGFEIKGANPHTFVTFGDSWWAKDGETIYWRDHKFAVDLDSASFSALSNVYLKDANKVYVFTYTDDADYFIAGADAKTFTMVSPAQSCGLDCTYDAQDKNHKYYGGKIVE